MGIINLIKPTKPRQSPSGSTSSTDSSLKQIASNLEEGKYKNIVFMVGAGISTAAGIPDFRTPGTGLYDNLEKLNLPFPEAVFDIDYFKEKPQAFFTLAKGLYPGQFEPTKFHKFMRWTQDQGMLKRVYTQNIDTLERIAGIDPDKIVEAHGSFASAHCIDCGEEMAPEEVKKLVLDSKGDNVVYCPECGGLVKPDIVFFGEGLPERFFDLMTMDFADNDIDLVIVAGTSLQVSPFNQLPDMAHQKIPRVLFNMEKVGSLGSRKSDVLVLGATENVEKTFPFIVETISEDKESKTPEQKEAEKTEKSAEVQLPEPGKGATEPKSKTPEQKEPEKAAESAQVQLPEPGKGVTEPKSKESEQETKAPHKPETEKADHAKSSRPASEQTTDSAALHKNDDKDDIAKLAEKVGSLDVDEKN